jgi:hypothetical protein
VEKERASLIPALVVQPADDVDGEVAVIRVAALISGFDFLRAERLERL